MANTRNSQHQVESSKVAEWLAIAACVMTVASSLAVFVHRLLVPESDIARKVMKALYVELELNVPAFYSATLMLFASALLAYIWSNARARRDNRSYMWAVLAVGFLVMAFDELVSAHERLIEPMREIIGGGRLGILYFPWVVPAFVLLIALAVFFRRFILDLPPRMQLLTGIGGIMFLTGAVGFELLEGYHVERASKETLQYFLLTTGEEFLEMTGVIVFIKALLEHLAAEFPRLSLVFTNKSLVPAASALRGELVTNG
jgi:hypothetical protein